MLDNTDNQRLQERIAEVASFLPGLAAASAPSSENIDEPADGLPPFGKYKVDRILERVYDRIANEASENLDPRLRELLTEALAHPETAPAFPERKLQRILARVQARLEADKAPATSSEPAKKPARRMSALASLRFAASALLLRHLSFETRLLSDHRGPRPLTDGPTD
ncbi:MAG TPA: hypothetical protein VMG10_23340 [Gemmataceae bacterium]|nr:hypothetical protein [Gemmataceae bacterium]